MLTATPLLDDSPYGRIEKRATKWYLADARPDVAMRFRRLFHAELHPGREDIPLPTSIPGFWTELNWFMKRYPLCAAPEDRKALERLITKDLEHAEAVLEFNTYIHKPALLELPLRMPLREYQKKAVEAIALQQHILVADDVGLGKTAVAIASILKERRTPALFVTMTQLFKQAVREFAKFTATACIERNGAYHDVDETAALPSPGSDVLIIHSIDGLLPYELPPADVYVMKYSCLRGWEDVFARDVFRYVVFDECQELRRKGTGKYNAARVAAKHADFCVGLTATPIYNYGDEVFNVLNLLKPRCLGTLKDFVAAWGEMTRFHKLIIHEPAALGSVLREQLLMIRRTKHEVGLELPEVQHVIEYVDHDVQRFNASLGEILELAKHTLFGFTSEDRMNSMGRFDTALRHATGVAKAHYVAARTRIVLESGQPVILVGWHRDTYEIWKTVLAEYAPVLITGSESPQQKDANKLAFIRGDTNLLILSLRSGEGMDGLQENCSIVVFGELDWSPQIHHQIIGRLHRFGQQESVLALFLLSREGSDPAVAEVLDLKSEQAFHIMNPEERFAPELDTRGGEKRLQEIAAEFLRRYEVDLDKARAEFEMKEPDSYWSVLAALESFSWDRHPDERRCQELLHTWLTDLGVGVRREAPVNGGLIDLLTEDGVGVEVKLSPTPRGALVRQIRSYIQDDAIRAIIVAAVDPEELPERLYGKRITAVNLRRAARLSAG